MNRKKINNSTDKGNNPNMAIVIAMLGLIGTLVTAYFGFRASTEPTVIIISATKTAEVALTKQATQTPLSATQTEVSNNAALSQSATVSPTGDTSSPITFLPIPNKELLVKGFKIDGYGERANLRFVAKSFDLNFILSAPLNMKCYSFLNSFFEQFDLNQYMQIDMANFPTGYKGGFWIPNWLLAINGKKVDTCGEQTLRDMAVVDGDLIGLKLEWSIIFQVSMDGMDSNGETQKTPPNISP